MKLKIKTPKITIGKDLGFETVKDTFTKVALAPIVEPIKYGSELGSSLLTGTVNAAQPILNNPNTVPLVSGIGMAYGIPNAGGLLAGFNEVNQRKADFPETPQFSTAPATQLISGNNMPIIIGAIMAGFLLLILLLKRK